MNSTYKIGEPLPSQQKELRLLWKEAFGDDDTFLDTFEATAFSSSRCRCATINSRVVAALYWFDCSMNEKKIAYIYAVATSIKFRGQGICHALIEDTHQQKCCPDECTNHISRRYPELPDRFWLRVWHHRG